IIPLERLVWQSLDPGYEVSAKQYARWARIETRSGALFLQRMHGFLCKDWADLSQSPMRAPG
ncbi:MAG TPA: hypothetical protein VK620_29740, partial [Bradyrhizobium sp.]|nr:hypothetical protein [Bradyrhizobium sp.]